jgi:hypothetical protein
VKLLTLLLILIAVAIGLFVLAPIVAFCLAFAVPIGALIIWFLPILIIATSDKTGAAEKLAWILATIFLSWFAWVFYFLLAPLSDRTRDRHYRYY